MAADSSVIRDPCSAPAALPAHVAIIMDGNRRWAAARGLPQTVGHKRGLEAAKAVVKHASGMGIRYVTLYTFSTENWKRTEEEVGFLMNLVMTHLRAEMDFYRKNNIRVRFLGRAEDLPANVSREIDGVCAATAGFPGMCVNLAINYGGRDEIIRAVKKLSPADIAGLTEENFASFLDIPDLPPVDLLIRTGGDQRISNFLLWQSAYAELYFSPELWPDWTGEHFERAVADFANRERRFGGL